MTRKVLSRHWGQAIVVALAALLVAVGAAPAARRPTLAYVPLGDLLPGGLLGNGGRDGLNVGTGALVGTIPLSVRAFSIAINPTGTRAYVVDENGVAVINLQTREVVEDDLGRLWRRYRRRSNREPVST